MQSTEMNTDLNQLLQKPDFNGADYDALKELAFSRRESLNRLLELLAELEQQLNAGSGDAKSAALKLGLSYLALGVPARAADFLQKATPSALRDLHLATAFGDLKRYDEADRLFHSAATHGRDAVDCTSRRAELLITQEHLDDASKLLDSVKANGAKSAQYHYTCGRLAHARGDAEIAMNAFEEAVRLDDMHAHATFHLAFILDLHGSDDEAFELYNRCAEMPFVHSHALINLAILFEDQGKYKKASACLKRVLAVDPNNKRARLYLKDVSASSDMFIDEHDLKDREKRSAVLDIPVSDFELSVRSRNCLKKMNINTLGDLLRTTEAELLSYKNFGETSLREIKAMLKQKGLGLGQELPGAAAAADAPELPANANAEHLAKPVEELELSVRSRKCLQRLGITTIGELICRTEAELLGSRNFGMTSLNEIKSCLTTHNLSLRPSR